jgi:hypothetical protein
MQAFVARTLDGIDSLAYVELPAPRSARAAPDSRGHACRIRQLSHQRKRRLISWTALATSLPARS